MRRSFQSALWFVVFANVLTGCTQFKPTQDRPKFNRAGVGKNADGESGGSGGPAVMTTKPVELVVANAKLIGTPGAYKAVIKFQSSSLTQEFTPTGAESRLKIEGLPANVSGVIAIELYQGEVLKFVAKRANTKLDVVAANQIVIDDCLVLPAPWDGQQHNGSCEWTIEDLN
jgi:hypothetical protein